MAWLINLFTGGALSALTALVTPLFAFLNKRVETAAQVHIADAATLEKIATGTTVGIAAADTLNAQIRLKEGGWSPWVLVTIGGFMVPFAWHTWQVCLDSSRWIITVGPYYFPVIVEHQVGSWRVAALPGMFETTEHAVIQSLFIGAGVAVGALPVIAALKK